MKTATTLSCLLLTPWLLAQNPFTQGEDALRADMNLTESDSFAEGGGYDSGGYEAPYEEEENTIETDVAAKPDSIEGGSKGAGEHEEKPGSKGGNQAHAEEEGSFAEESKPKSALKAPADKKKKQSN
jgi:hypothetical protein